MPSSLSHPKTGLRFVLERPLAGPPWEYRGTVFGPGRDAWELAATVSAQGEVDVRLAGADPGELAEKTRLLLRALYKHAQKDGDGAPPRKVVRWRGEK